MRSARKSVCQSPQKGLTSYCRPLSVPYVSLNKDAACFLPTDHQ
jgi:hypothetical protein